MLPIERIQERIYIIRDHKVMLDHDLADLYGVTTKALNQAVKRNRARFPTEFMFRLTSVEKTQVVTNCDHLQKLRFSPVLPNVFTEHGAVMLASVLKSPRAIEMSLFVVKAFIKASELMAAHQDLLRKLEKLEKKYDRRFKAVFNAIRALMGRPVSSPAPNRLPSIPKVKGFSLKRA